MCSILRTKFSEADEADSILSCKLMAASVDRAAKSHSETGLVTRQRDGDKLGFANLTG